MKIAQVAPLFESVPPQCYGGTERVIFFLTEELVRQGHEVTLFASGDSQTSAHLMACTPKALRLSRSCANPLPYHMELLEQVFQRTDEFDIVHFHIDYLHFPLSRRCHFHQLTTLHGRLDLPDLFSLYREFRDMPLVSISNAQRKPLPWVNWAGNVYHGLPLNLFKLQEKPGNYLAFLGRIAPEKGPDLAIEIARRSGVPLKIAAKVDRADKDYFEACIKPLLNDPLVEFIGEINDREKEEFLGNARALLFPINWPEPFGLVMIESMACGTPVIAFRNGSVSEVLMDGVTGFIVEDAASAIQAVSKIGQIDRKHCRRVFERGFSSETMARGYLDIYNQLIHLRSDRPSVSLEKTAEKSAALGLPAGPPPTPPALHSAN